MVVLSKNYCIKHCNLWAGDGCSHCAREEASDAFARLPRPNAAKLVAFAQRFLDPEDLGYTVNEALRDEAREALGIPRVIKKAD